MGGDGVGGAGRDRAALPTVRGTFNFQTERVPASVLSSGQVYVARQSTGSDTPPVGTEVTEVEVDVANGRGKPITLDEHGFELVNHEYEHVNYFDSREVVSRYYREVAEMLREKLGARKVFVFDHNLRSSAVRTWYNDGRADEAQQEKKLAGSEQTVQSSARLVHNDYTLVSAKRRVELLAEPARANDTWNVDGGSAPLIPAEDLKEFETRRWALVNVWRNIVDTPVEDVPLAMVDGRTVDREQLVTFEVRYSDRVGENYLARHSDKNTWMYFPRMEKNEAILLKVWDSDGELVASLDPETGDVRDRPAIERPTVPASFAIHSAFADPSAAPGCPARQSIEVRTVVLY